MFQRPAFFLTPVLLLMLPVLLSAQNAQPEKPGAERLQPRQIIGSVSAGGIRFCSLGETIQMRLEVIGSAGDVLFDSELRSGNAIDWLASDNNGQRLADGSYLCVIS